MPQGRRAPKASIVIPAHNEEAVIGRCLAALTGSADNAGFEIVVVCNGCTDRTAEVAASFGQRVIVDSIPAASKIAALNRGDELADSFPRLYLDADVVLGSGAVMAIAGALSSGEALAAAPEVSWDTSGCSVAARSYYRIWTKLPSVRDDLVSRGAYALSEQGRARFERFPDVLGDDHFVRDLFAPHERRVVQGAHSTVALPRTLRHLVGRKMRVVAGNRALDRASSATRRRARARARQWIGVVRAEPARLLDVPVYLGVTAAAQIGVRARRLRRRPAWGRDPSTRPSAS